MKRLDLILLDLDGTLYSSTATTVGAVGKAVSEFNGEFGLTVAVPSEDGILGGIGLAREEYVAAVLPDVPEDHRGRMSDLIWRWEHALVESGHGSLFPGVKKTLAALHHDGYELAVATNAGTGYMDFILDHFEIRELFAETRCAGESGLLNKDDLIVDILGALAVAPKRAVMVGDRRSDIVAARSAGTWAVGCTWGFATRDELTRADRIIDSFPQLHPLVEEWP